MPHIALYRSFRPQTFQEIVGQQHIIRTLQNALREERYTHAYLFSGPRGTGKTSAAKILAKAVNCEKGPASEPCNECSACRKIAEGSLMDVIEIDAASNNGVDEIRDLRDKVKFAPTEARHKVYIIDEVHMLTTGAFNALLKTLEEPPPHVIFILATTEPYKLPVTIISRCQRFDFKRISVEEQISRLQWICNQEKIAAEETALEYIARLSDGGMRDALSLLDQIAAYAGNQITYNNVLDITGGLEEERFYELAEAVFQQDMGKTLETIGVLLQEGKSAEKCMENLISYFRDLLMVKMIPERSGEMASRIVDIGPFQRLSEQVSAQALFSAIETLNRFQSEMKFSAQPQTLLEVAMLKLCTEANGAIDSSVHEESVLTRLQKKIERLEEQIEQMAKQDGSAAFGTAEKPATFSQSPQRPTGIRNTKAKPDAFLQAKDSHRLKTVSAKWNQVLSQVKSRRITVHAWLIDGEPVSATEEMVLLAFKSAMHRENTERSAHKEIIEKEMESVFGQPYQLMTVMLKDWEDRLAENGSSDKKKSESDAPPLQMEAEDPGSHKEEWINQAIELFGKDMVVIEDE